MEAAPPYRGADRRRVGRGADASVGWVVAASGLLVVAALAAALAVGAGVAVPAALAADTAVALLRAAGTVGALAVGALVLKQAVLTGEATPRLAGPAVVLLAVVLGAVELPAALGVGPAGLMLTLRAAGLLTAAGLLALAMWWSTVDAGLRSRHVAVMVAGALAGSGGLVGLVVAAAGAASAGPVVNGVVVAALVAVAGALAWRGWCVGRRLLAVGALLLMASGLAQLPLVGGLWQLGGLATVLEALRVVAIAMGTVVALDDLEAAFVAQRHALLRTEVDRRTVAARLQAHREHDQERAHEARSALAAIEGASTRLARYQAALDDDGRVALSSAIQAEIRRLQHLVDAERPAEPQPLPLSELVESEASMCRQHGMTVHVEVTAGLWVLAERDAVIGVLRNLLVNARTHAPEATVWVTAAVDGDAVELQVRDDGPGLTARDLAHAFERGHRGEGADRRAGSGLGLHVARNLAERHGGSLTADSAPGQGATFALRLPRPPETGQSRGDTPRPAPWGRPGAV